MLALQHFRCEKALQRRGSIGGQGQSGLGLDAHRAAVAGFVGGRELITEFTEVESGKRNDRPQLAAAMDLCRRHKAVLLIAKLDRLARNVAFRGCPA
jgi:DNA invertase Pin-like site-specific DNA recombinase